MRDGGNTSSSQLDPPNVLTDAIAIVGIGCRFAGGIDSPESFWSLVREGLDGTVDVPEARWDSERFYDSDHSKPGTYYVRRGGFIRQAIDEFDALFFGISPREAAPLDPQQRLLLEVTWEAFEDAGIPPDGLAGSPTGVFVGGFIGDNQLTQQTFENRDFITSHTAVSATLTMLSNRISYVFDFRGPSVSIDTACSSSLVAMHYACESLRRGESSVAVTGGVNLMFRPETIISLCKGQFLAEDGRSKAFDERADGYGRGEGAGIVILKRLSDALKDGNRIYAVIRGSGVNQDGRTDGITVPNAEAQMALMRAVCTRAAVDPSSIAYVEAHGTGTAVGDPLEASAIGSVYGQHARSQALLPVGSVKANIGHTEAAAGVAGTIKAALSLYHQEIAPLANLGQPNPNIAFADLGLRLPRAPEPLMAESGPGLAAVNSFGYGGTNGHVILQEPPPRALRDDVQHKGDFKDVKPYVLPLSARSDAALRDLARAYLNMLSSPHAPALRDACYGASLHRAHMNYRLAIAAASVEDLHQGLMSYLDSEVSDSWVSGRADAGSVQQFPVFVYTGMGPQWWGMGRELFATEPVFRCAAEACDRAFVAASGWSILQEMLRDEADSRMAETQIAQPANFLLQVALTALWQSWGIEPGAIVGHSVGEVTAAYVAGVLTLDEAALVSYHRSRIQKKAAGTGKMLAVGAEPYQVEKLLQDYEGLVSLAAINGPSTVTLAGDGDSLDIIAAALEEQRVFNRFLRVEVPYHSPRMEPLLPEVRECLQGVSPRQPNVPLYSTVTGQQVTEVSYDAEYWCRNIRQPVLFAQAVEALHHDGRALFLEVGPNPVLGSSIKEVLLAKGVSAAVLTSLRRGKPELPTMRKSLLELYAKGCRLHWAERYESPGRFVDLPNYPWQRERYWHEPERLHQDRLGLVDHPLLGLREVAPRPVWQQRIGGPAVSWLPEHGVDGLVVFPGAGYIEMGLAAARLLMDRPRQALSQVTFLQAMVLEPHQDRLVRTEYDPASQAIRMYSRTVAEQPAWVLHASATLSSVDLLPVPPVDVEAIRSSCTESLDVAEVYENLHRRGLSYGPAFRGMQHIQKDRTAALVEIELQEGIDADDYMLHPTLLDAAFQSLIAIVDTKLAAKNGLYVPVLVEFLRRHGDIPSHVLALSTLKHQDEQSLTGDIVICDASGQVLVEVLGLRCQALASSRDRGNESDEWFYRARWDHDDSIEATVPDPDSPRKYLAFADRSGQVRSLLSGLDAVGGELLWADQQGSEAILRADSGLAVDWSNPSSELMQALACADAVVYGGGLDVSDPASEECVSCISDCNALFKAIATCCAETDKAPRVYVLTQDACAINEEDGVNGLAQSGVMGLARVAVNEYPQLMVTVIDIGAGPGLETGDLLRKELMANSAEDMVALRPAGRYVQRLQRVEESGKSSLANAGEQRLEAEQACRLEVGVAGQINSLRFREIERRAPEAGEIEVAVMAVGLNFKDVAKVMDMIGSEALSGTFFGNGLGMEAAGVVVRTGSGVSGISAGQRLVFNVPDCFSTHLTLPVEGLHYRVVPEWISLEEAAGVPTVFITVHYALRHVARLRAGETVLIHSAAGGVGLSAIQVAHSVGAKVIATAGSEEKADYLRSIGVEQVFHSRSLQFVEHVRQATGGRGVDVVLNALPGEFIAQSLAVLAPFGRFIELGKRDIVENSKLPLAPFNENLSFSSVDVDRLTALRPDYTEELLSEVLDCMLKGDYKPLPTKVFAASEVIDAFKLMARAQHIGKVVVSVDAAQGINAIPLPKASTGFDPNGSYLVTGGCGGFGLVLAQWLVTQGVRHLVLVGRRGAASDEARVAISELQHSGAEVTVLTADVSDAQQVAALMTRINDELPPLRGVFHGAAVLDDAPMAELTAERFARVFAPKALAAWHLHVQTQALPLTHFVLFSSVAALIGNSRQANYVAANVFLDNLAHYRRARGLVGTSVNWGAIADAGMAVDPQVRAFLEMMGLMPMPPLVALDAYLSATALNLAQFAIAAVDWQRWSASEPTASARPRFSELVGQSAGSEAVSEFKQALSLLQYGERLEMLALALAEQVAETLRIPSDRIEVGKALTELGLDSLMAVEIQGALRVKLGVELSTLDLLKGSSILQLSESLLAKLGLGHENTLAVNTNAAPKAPTPTADVDTMSDAEVDVLLGQLSKEGV